MAPFLIGHTGITWGIPGDVETAYRDVAELGYLGFETFTQTILEWNGRPGGYRRLVEQNKIPTSAGYCYKEWTASRKALDEAKAEADGLAALPGATALVVQAGSRSSDTSAPDELAQLADILNELGAHCDDIGLRVGLHPHTDTAVETRSDIDTILSLSDPRLVGLAPDTGQIAKAGCDVLDLLRVHGDRIVHVHLKDWNGEGRTTDGAETDHSGYLNYEAIGDGVLPINSILDVLTDEVGYAGWVNVELDRTTTSPRPAREAAARSRHHLETLLGSSRFRQTAS
ncbi:sugar phosphate isomerase/epimerase family protein [Herbiconiux ginsengi]|uniref:Sugar phosphate isomerase/epimerase n=1 Tax=Herbiconiux ginsengi TaxID=381665 RepID=A0A1H3LLC0_9MICO|nr:sugar phosphate isomerase/epimerase [Herbiconiux ginsengi]SDY65163.1 Sugar phosphate isomerase/epimerase [Herbiconiux ginsengi]